MATVEASFDSCVTCSSKYNRTRTALCQCKHCSNSFCFDCMKDHNDSLQENIAQVSNQYNEVQLLLKTKTQLIIDETNKSKKQISEWLQKYIADLTAEKTLIDAQIEKEGQEAKKFISDIETQLQTISRDIEGFSKTSAFQSADMQKLLKNLEDLTQQLSSLTLMRECDLPSVMPRYKLKSTCPSLPTASEVHTCPSLPTASEVKTNENTANNNSFPGKNYFRNRENSEPTSYDINRMATDGINILYSSSEKSEHDLIAYCYLDRNDDHYQKADPYRPWRGERIVDMIWWGSIGKFVCATKTDILTVEYQNERFKISTVIRNLESNMRIGANSTSLWAHISGTIKIYNSNFKLVRSIEHPIPPEFTRASFCIIDDLVAFLMCRRDDSQQNRLQIQFYDSHMNQMKSFDLGTAKKPCMVRSDGTDRFYITTGKDEFHIMSSKGRKQTIQLDDEASFLAVVNATNIVCTRLRADVELVHIERFV